MPGYVEEVYDYIDSEDSTFKDKVSKEDFKTAIKDKSYSDEIYGYMTELDSSFKDKIDEQVFFESVSGDGDPSKKEKIVSQFDTEDPVLFDEQTINKRFDGYIKLLEDSEYRNDKITSDTQRVAELEKVKGQKQEFLDLLSVEGSEDKIKAAQALKNLQQSNIPTEEDIAKEISDNKFFGDKAIQIRKQGKDLSTYSDEVAEDQKITLPSGMENIQFKGEEFVKENLQAQEFGKSMSGLVSAANEIGLTPTSDISKVEKEPEKYTYIPNYEDYLKDNSLFNKVSIDVLEKANYNDKFNTILENNKNKKETRDEEDRILSEFEGEQGVGLLNNMANLIIKGNPITGPSTIIKEVLFDKDLDKSIGLDGTSRESYKKNKEDLGRLLELEKIGNDYRAYEIIDNVEKQSANLITQQAAMVKLKRKIESDPTATQEDIDQFNSIRKNVILGQKKMQADLDYLGDIKFEGSTAQEIIDKTQKTYNTLEVHENIFKNSGVRIMSGLSSLATELNVVNLLEHVGVDLKNEDGTINQEWIEWGNDVLGEKGGAVLTASIIKEVAKDNIADKLLEKSYNYGEELLNRNRPPQRYDDIKGVDQAMRWGTEMLTGQILNTGMSIVIPGGGGLLLSSLSESGNQMHDMKIRMKGEKWSDSEVKYINDFKKEFGFNPLGDDDTYKIKPEDINALQFYGTAGIYGIAEYASERITLGNFKLGAKNLRKAFDLSKGIKKGMPITNKINQRWINLREAGKDFAKGIPGESLGEGAVTLSQNAAEIYILGNKDVSMLDGVTESMMSGLVMSGTMQSPGLLAQTYTAFRGPDANAKIAERGMEMLNLSNQIKNFETQLSGLTPKTDKHSEIVSAKRLAENRLHNLAQQQLDSQSETRKDIVSYTKTDRQALIDTYNAEHKVRAEIDRINDNTALDPKTAAKLINEQETKLVQLEAFKNSVVGNAEWNADKTRARKFSNAYRAKNNLLGEVEMIVGNNNKEALQAGLDYVDTRKDLTAEEKNQVKEQMKMTFEDAKKASRGDSTVNGFAFGDNLTVETTLPDGTKTTKKIDVPMTFALNRSNATVQSHEVGHHTLFKEFIENNPDAVGLVQDLENYVKKNYSKAYEVFLETKQLYGEYDSQGNLTNPTLVAEEKLARLSDFMRQNNLEADRTLHNKMFGRFQKFNDGSGQIKTGKDVFDMLTSYNKSFETGELSGLTKSIAEGTAKIARKKKGVEKETKPAKRSMTKAEQNKVEDTLNNAPGQRNKDGKYTMTKAEWRADKNRAFSKAYNALMNGDLDGLIIAKMASGKDIFGQAREEFISDARDKIGQHMLNFDPQMQDSLFGWVNSYISRKVGDVAKKAKREKEKTPGTKISTDQKLGEEGRTVAETIEGDTAGDIEAAVDRSLKAKKKGIDNLRTRLGIEKGGTIYNKVVESVKKVFGAKLPEVSNKNFKEALKKDFNTLLFKDIKNDIGTRAKYKEFIEGDITFKDADGNTKTMPRWEMLYDYISQSTFNKRFEPFIEPLIDPATGRQARPDNNPLFTKKKITKEQWVDYFLGDKVGASTKGTRKDALASAIAQELAFDATMETISDPDIQARIKDIYESQGLKQVENYLEQVAKEIDRKPDSKFSITKKPVVERLQKHMEDSKGVTPIEAFDNFYNKLNEGDKQAIISERSAIENISKKEAKRFNRKIKETKPKRKEEKGVLARQDQIVEEAGYRPLERRGEGRASSIKYLMTNFFPKLFKEFGDVSSKFINTSNLSPSGNEAFSYKPDGKIKGGAIKRAQLFITSAIKTKKSILGTLKAIQEGNLETVDAVKKLQKNTDFKNLPNDKANNIEVSLRKQKTKDLQRNLKTREQHKKGSMAYLSLFKKMYDADNNMLPGIQFLNYNQNANDANYRNLAQLIGVENGVEKGREEHIYQAGPWSTRVLQAITAKNPKVFEAFNKWQAENYYQETIAEKNKEGTSSESLIDGTYTMPDGSTWEAKSQEHPILKKALDEAMITGDFSNVPSPDIRKYNEVFHLNPNNIIREGISDATRYNVEVAEDLRNIPEVIELQAELIFLQLSGQMDAATAKGYLEAGIPIAKAKFSVTKDNKKMLNDSGVVDTSTELTNAETIEQAGVLDDALNVARNPKAPIKKIRVFDFDDTLAKSKSLVFYNKPNETGKPTPERKAIFMIGGPGSGKSNIGKGLQLGRDGFKVVNQDIFIETEKAKAGLPESEKEYTKEQRSKRAKIGAAGRKAAEAKMDKYTKAGNGMVIDGTGASYNATMKKVNKLKEQGYEVFMVHAKTSNEVALERNKARKERSLPDFIVEKTQESVNNNIDKYKNDLGDNFLEIDTETIEYGKPLPKEFVDDVKSNLYKDERGVLSAEEFAQQGKSLVDQGAVMDFSDFNIVREGEKGPLFNVAKKIKDARGNEDLFVLTARAPESQQAIYEFLKSEGLKFKKENIIGLGNSTGEAKAQWLVGKAAEGYNDFYFADDAMQNVDAVKKAMSVLDVKSKVQQAKVKFSKTVDKTVNDIIEHKTGIKSKSEYSDVKARLKGRKKGRFEIFIPPSAEDFVGLLYKMIGKGEIGNMQMDFFKEHLIDPYGRAMENLSRDQNRMINDFKALKDQLVKEGLIPKNLNKKAFGEYTLQDIARVLAWNKQGFDVPGISKTDLKQILSYAKKNPAIDVFAQNLIDINKGDGYSAPNKDWLAGTISTDLLDGLRTGKRSKYLQQWKENVDLIFSPKNLNKMEAAFGSKWREAMENMLSRMESGRNRSNKMGRLENALLDYINNSVGTVMFFNMRSALLQTISAINFIDFGSNNVFRAAKAFANQKQYWSDFMELMNSEFLVERRNGLKLNVSESEIADAAATSKNKAKAAVAYILQKGYLPTQFADSFAIASGGATFYRNRIDALMKEGMSEADAKKQAFLEFREIAEESQQSSRPDRVSQQQASVLGRLILAFQNTPMQMNRLGKKAFLDLVNRRKRPGMTQFQSDMSNASRVTYYFAVQSAIFSALQQALFALAFNDDEEESEKERYYNIANGMLNTFLNGTGMIGVAASTLISVGRKVYKESAKEGQFPGPNYEDAANEMLNFSPPIDIKLSKLRQAGLTWKYEGYKHDEANWGIDDPAYKSAAYVISGLTNVPLDRLISKSENVRSAIEDEQQTWKRVSLLLGWRDYQLNSTEERQEYVTSQKEAKAAYRKKMKNKGTRQYTPKNLMTPKQLEEEKIEKQRIKYKKLNQAEQVRKLDSLGLSKKQIKSLKYEKDRVAKLIQLMNK